MRENKAVPIQSYLSHIIQVLSNYFQNKSLELEIYFAHINEHQVFKGKNKDTDKSNYKECPFKLTADINRLKGQVTVLKIQKL